MDEVIEQLKEVITGYRRECKNRGKCLGCPLNQEVLDTDMRTYSICDLLDKIEPNLP